MNHNDNPNKTNHDNIDLNSKFNLFFDTMNLMKDNIDNNFHNINNKFNSISNTLQSMDAKIQSMDAKIQFMENEINFLRKESDSLRIGMRIINSKINTLTSNFEETQEKIEKQYEQTKQHMDNFETVLEKHDEDRQAHRLEMADMSMRFSHRNTSAQSQLAHHLSIAESFRDNIQDYNEGHSFQGRQGPQIGQRRRTSLDD
ncbi:MAG: hypothetical protein H7839_21655 [Magnetococcus sp. YQC-5]